MQANNITLKRNGQIMNTKCLPDNGQLSLEFQGLGKRKVEARFDGEYISSDGGALLLREIEARTGIISELSSCFEDHRDQRYVQHPLNDLIAQRIFGLALGYEDLIDHDRLRADPLIAIALGKTDPTGAHRSNPQDVGKALAGKSTLNRVELSSERCDRYCKTPFDSNLIRETLVNSFIRITELKGVPKKLVLNIDATDDTIHGNQDGKFFHKYYDAYCYMPLYTFCDGHPLVAKLGCSSADPAKGSIDELEFIVGKLRARWPKVRIILRGDCGFCRSYILDWCEDNGVDYILGLAKNNRLKKIIGRQLYAARRRHAKTGKASRVFTWFWYKTEKSWRHERRVIAKAEHLDKGANPRFIVTSLPDSDRKLYEKVYCARGEMENRIKEQQLDLFADRTSTHWVSSNQLRLWFSTFAYILLNACRILGMKGTIFSRAQCRPIRLKLMKIGTAIKFSVRRISISFAIGYPWYKEFCQIHRNICTIPLRI